MAPDPLTCVSHSPNAKYQFKQYFTGGPINLLRKYSNPKFDPPSNIPGHGPEEMILKYMEHNNNTSAEIAVVQGLTFNSPS